MELRIRKAVTRDFSIKVLIALFIGLLTEFLIHSILFSLSQLSYFPSVNLFDSNKTYNSLIYPIVVIFVLFLMMKYIKNNNPYFLSITAGLLSGLIIMAIDYMINYFFEGELYFLYYLEIIPAIALMIFVWIIMMQSEIPISKALSVGYFGFLLLRGFIGLIIGYFFSFKLSIASIILGIFFFAILALIFELLVRLAFKIVGIRKLI